MKQIFVKIKPLLNGKVTLLFIDIAKSAHSCECLTWQMCLLDNAIRENIILMKIYEFTVCVSQLSAFLAHLSRRLMGELIVYQ